MNDIKTMIVIAIKKNKHKQIRKEFLDETLSITTTCNRFLFYTTEWFDNMNNMFYYYNTTQTFRIKRKEKEKWYIAF